MGTNSSTAAPSVDTLRTTRAESAAIENVGRFITDSLLAPGALEDFFKGDVARPREVRDAYDQARRLWKKVAYRSVGESSAAGLDDDGRVSDEEPEEGEAE